MAPLIFRSRMDAWLLAVMLGTPIAVIAGAMFALPREPLPLLVVTAAAVVSVGLPIWLLVTTRYELFTDALRITSGPYRWSVPLTEIKSITPTRNPIASPALSLSRLEIRYGVRQSVLISPVDPESFLRAIEARR